MQDWRLSEKYIETSDPDEWTVAEKEANTLKYSCNYHGAEVESYKIMTELQGIHVPKFFADIRIDDGSNTPLADIYSKYMLAKAVLLEFIDAFPLTDMPKCAPESKWAEICNEVITMTNKIGDSGILNENTVLENVLVRTATDCYQVVFFDFAYCHARSAYRSQEDWIEAKRREDEEARLGQRMENLISRAKGKRGKLYKGTNPLPWSYVPSHRYGAPGFPLVPDEHGCLIDPVIDTILRLPLNTT